MRKFYRGHKYWKLNCQTKEITETNEWAVVEPYCLYTTALNKENAAKKFLKMVKKLPEKTT
jgi:hypothetical protein